MSDFVYKNIEFEIGDILISYVYDIQHCCYLILRPEPLEFGDPFVNYYSVLSENTLEVIGIPKNTLNLSEDVYYEIFRNKTGIIETFKFKSIQ